MRSANHLYRSKTFAIVCAVIGYFCKDSEKAKKNQLDWAYGPNVDFRNFVVMITFIVMAAADG